MKNQDELNTELESLKRQYKKVYTLEVPLDEDQPELFATIFLKRPGKSERKLAEKLHERNSDNFIEAILNALYVGGDDIKLVTKNENEDVMLSTQVALIEIFTVQQAILKKN